ncbi:Phage integrase family protein [Cupriavidus taiwanensis]|uniref:integrase n=1 Tax=Cupriavidus taiwanensis TaxID=164546 RepID=UPI000E1AA328|nr:integrase [Cupriavidus taiwanensis]SOZ24670.1 Phage integrase family protein [Cupriavidus taiwanensis]
MINNVDTNIAARTIAQPNDVRALSPSERDRLIVSTRKLDGKLRVVSHYGDSVWWIIHQVKCVTKSNTKIDFDILPLFFRSQAKAIVYRYMRRGAPGSGRPPAGSTVVQFFTNLRLFLSYLARISIRSLSEVTPLVCSNYANLLKREKKKENGESGLYAKRTIEKKVGIIDKIYGLSKFTDNPITTYPWPDASLGAKTKTKSKKSKTGCKTPLMSDDVFTRLFNRAWNIVTNAVHLFGLRSDLQNVRAKKKDNPSRKYITMLKTPALTKAGFEGTFSDFKAQLLEVRIACYVVIASLSGCRVHELAHMRANCYYSTIGKDGERYWWIRSESHKTYEGPTEWMVPEAAISAVRVLEKWAAPYQEKIRLEIEEYRRNDPNDLRIAEAQEHKDSLFLGFDSKNGSLVRTLGRQVINVDLKDFSRACGLKWVPKTHQFRRKFANYVAKSKFGDLRYLREHFKHWAMDMTLGYALNESQEMALFLEIQDELEDIKIAVVDSWLDNSEPLTGGYGENLVRWRQSDEAVAMFKTRSQMVRFIASSTPIRSNGHAWCTAEDGFCVGNNLDRTRCGAGCENGVLGRAHQEVYVGLFRHLKELKSAKDIGPGGLERVHRDVARCEEVLAKLGCELQEEV